MTSMTKRMKIDVRDCTVQYHRKSFLKLVNKTIWVSSSKSTRHKLLYQRNRHQMKKIITKPRAAKGPYCSGVSNHGFMNDHRAERLTCFNSNSQFILTAAFRYFLLSSLNLPLISPILSKLSPLYNRSSIFFVMTFVTSFNSSFNLSRFADALESWYVFLVRWINVSNSTKAYGRRVGEWYCVAG